MAEGRAGGTLHWLLNWLESRQRRGGGKGFARLSWEALVPEAAPPIEGRLMSRRGCTQRLDCQSDLLEGGLQAGRQARWGCDQKPV